MNNIAIQTRTSAEPGFDDQSTLAVASAANDYADSSYRAKATAAAIKFEAFFISHMLHQMRSGTRELAGEDSVFKDPVNSDMLDLADTMMADKMAGQRAFGIADAILRQLLPKPPIALTSGAVTGGGAAPSHIK